jgi:hypothetical protein
MCNIKKEKVRLDLLKLFSYIGKPNKILREKTRVVEKSFA